jgi:thiol-disulfide isomerase/thioredoxin
MQRTQSSIVPAAIPAIPNTGVLQIAQSTKHFVATVYAQIPVGTPVIVDCSAVWCSPCRALAPHFAAAAVATPSISFWKLDVDQCDEAAAAFGVEAMPTVLLLRRDDAGELGLIEAYPRIVGFNLEALQEAVVRFAAEATLACLVSDLSSPPSDSTVPSTAQA